MNVDSDGTIGESDKDGDEESGRDGDKESDNDGGREYASDADHTEGLDDGQLDDEDMENCGNSGY